MTYFSTSADARYFNQVSDAARAFYRERDQIDEDLHPRKKKKSAPNSRLNPREVFDDLMQSENDVDEIFPEKDGFRVAEPKVLEIDDDPLEPLTISTCVKCYCGDIAEIQEGIASSGKYYCCGNDECDYFEWLVEKVPKTVSSEDLRDGLVKIGERIDSLTIIIRELVEILQKSQ